MVTHHIGNMTKDLGKVYNFIRVLDMPERKGTDGNADFAKGVVAQNISFTYTRDSQRFDSVAA